MRTFFRFAILALVLVIVAMISGLTAMRFAIHGQEVAVPALVGLTPVDAERSVGGLGLQISIERQFYSQQVPEGKIMSQLPAPGTKVRRGWQVRVAQSLGPTRVAIPDVTGESEHAAELNIRRRGLDISSIADVETQGIPADQVLASGWEMSAWCRSWRAPIRPVERIRALRCSRRRLALSFCRRRWPGRKC